MAIPMRTFQGLMGNNPQPRTEPKLVGPAPIHPTKEDKLNAGDLAMVAHNRVGSPTTSDPVTDGMLSNGCCDESVFEGITTVTEAQSKIKRLISNYKTLGKVTKSGMKKMWSDPEFRKNYATALKVDLRNMKNTGLMERYPLDTGNFEPLKKRLLKLVASCKNEDELNYLSKDLNTATGQLSAMKTAIKDGKFETKCTVKDIEDYEKWIKEIYRPAISARRKEIKAMKTVKESTEPVSELFGLGKKPVAKEKKVIAKPLTDAQLKKAQTIAKTILNNPRYKVYKKAFEFDTMEKVKQTGQFSDGSYAVAYVDLHKAWPNLRAKLEVDNSIPDLETAFEAELNEKLNPLGMRGTTQGGDWDTTFLYIFNLDTLLETYHGYAQEKLPKDKTGYPTTNDPVLVDTQGIGAVIGVEEGLSLYGRGYVLEEIKNVLNGTTLEGIDSNLIEKFKEAYKYQLENADQYPDIPIVRQMSVMMERAYRNSIQSDDLSQRYAMLESELTQAMQTINTEAGFCPNQRNMNELTPMDPTMRIQSYPTYPAEACERSCARLIDNIVFAKTDDEITEAFMILARMENLVNEQYSACEEGIIYEGKTSMAVRQKVRSATRKISKTARSVKTNVKKATDPMTKFIDNTMAKAKKADSEERRNIILRGGVIPKVTRWLKRAIPISVGLIAGQVIPVAAVISAIAFLGWLASDKALDHREKAKILKELDDEIEMVNEKIEDARGDSNKQKKYELMRIRNKLTRTRDNVKLNLGSKVVGRLPEDEAIGHNKK